MPGELRKRVKGSRRVGGVITPERTWSPELLALAQQAVDRQAAERQKLAAMTPEERAAYIAAWAKRLAAESVEIGERGVGCACCDPDVKAKLGSKNV